MACAVCEEHDQLLTALEQAEMDESLRTRLVEFVKWSYDLHINAAGDAMWDG